MDRSLKESMTKTMPPLRLVHSDVMGSIETKTSDGSRFVLSFIDDFSKPVNLHF